MGRKKRPHDFADLIAGDDAAPSGIPKRPRAEDVDAQFDADALPETGKSPGAMLEDLE